MREWFTLAADPLRLSFAPRLQRTRRVVRAVRVVSVAANDQLPLVLLSFMSESSRLHIQRMRMVLGVRLRHPTVRKSVAVRPTRGKRLGATS